MLEDNAIRPPVQRVEGLDASLDRLIENLPEHLFGAPDDPVLEPGFSRDPFTPLAALRARAGAVVRRGEDGLYDGQSIFNVWGHDLSKPHFVALGYDAVNGIGTDAARFVNDEAYGAHLEAQGRTVNAYDGMDHVLRRRLFDRTMFGRAAMEEWCAQMTTPLAEYLVGRLKTRLEQGEEADLCRDIALPMAYKCISTIIGIPQEKFAHFVTLGEIAQSAPRDMNAAQQAVKELDAYFASELQARRQCPRHDMLTILDQEKERDWKMEEDEIIRHCRFLLPGGIETTWRQTANLGFAMMTHPDQYQAVVDDPSLVDQAVEEVLRWMPSGFVVPRKALVDAEVEGVHIPAGSFVCSIQGVANRDPKYWRNPNAFDIRREQHPHLTFHVGRHYCMGQHLARAIIRTSLRLWVQHLPAMRLAVPADSLTTRGLGVRCPAHVPVALAA